MDCGVIEPDKADVRQNPYSLPGGFVWDTLDLNDADQVIHTRINLFQLKT